MFLSDLSLPGALHTEDLNALLADRHRVDLAQGSFTVIVRSFSDLARGRETRPSDVNIVVSLKPEGCNPVFETGVELAHSSDLCMHNQN